MEFQQLLRYSILSTSIAVLAACSSADSSAPATTPTAVTISGSIFASDVSGATVTIKKTDGTTVAGPVTTNSDGSYSVDILDTDLASDLVFESTGGGFVDEETGLNANAGAMSAYIEGGRLAAGDSVHVTPGTTIHAGLVTGYGKSPTEAQAAFFKAFAYNPDSSVDPVDITDPASLNANDAAKHAGWCAAVFSRLSNNLMPNQPEMQFDLFAALSQDLSDGDLNGVDASGPVAIGTSGGDLPVDILNEYISAAGSFTVAEAANLKVTYTPPENDPTKNVHGKNIFTLTITDTAGNPQTNLTDLEVMPVMYMADRTHATPMGGVRELANGEYEVTAYYLMPSRMNMNQTTMGTWDIKVATGNKTVHFYPNIMMAMGDTVRSDPRLLGITDTILNMDGLESGRPYNIFRDGDPIPQGGPNYSFDIFIAAMETMMSFPPLVVGEILESGMGGTPLDVTSVEIDVNVNDGGWDDTSDQDNGGGHWTLNTLQLNPGVANEIKFRLVVNGETKTTDGLAVATDPGAPNYPNDFTTFTVTP